jgi:hypothetical protein
MTRPLLSAQGQPQAVASDGAIHIDLTLPVTRVGVGIFSFDPVEQFLGAPVGHFLEPLLRAPRFRRPSQAGPAVDVYPLRLPEGEGLSVPLGQWGDLGFANKHQLLVLTVPWQVKGWVEQRFAGAIVEGPRQGTSADGQAYVAHFAIRLRAGMKAGIPLGALGEVGVEACTT